MGALLKSFVCSGSGRLQFSLCTETCDRVRIKSSILHTINRRMSPIKITNAIECRIFAVYPYKFVLLRTRTKMQKTKEHEVEYRLMTFSSGCLKGRKTAVRTRWPIKSNRTTIGARGDEPIMEPTRMPSRTLYSSMMNG